MNFGQSISTCFRKYAEFNGRAGRSELWWFVLFLLLADAAAGLLDEGMFGGRNIVSGLWSLAVLIPSFAVWARRLHDTDRSGWWVLLSLIPIAGWIILIIWGCQRGTDGANRFGERPA